jgi:internalin A
MPALTKFGFNDGQLENLNFLANSPNLKVLILDIIRKNISLEVLASLHNITSINLKSVYTNLNDLSTCSKLKCLNLAGIVTIDDLFFLQGLSSLENLVMFNNKHLKCTEGLNSCKELKTISYTNDSYRLKTSFDLSGLNKLESLSLNCNFSVGIQLNDCTSLRDISLTGVGTGDLSFLQSCLALNKLDLHDLENLTSLAGLENCTQVTKLVIHGCKFLQNINAISNLIKLEVLQICNSNLVEFKQLDSVPSSLRSVTLFGVLIKDLSILRECSNLTSLSITNCPIKSIKFLSEYTGLKSLILRGCLVSDIGPLYSVSSLEYLELSLEKLTSLKPLRKSTNLLRLVINSCLSLVRLDGLENCSKLLTLKVSSCCSLSDIGALSKCTSLVSCSFDVSKITNFQALTNCPNLVKLKARGKILDNFKGYIER